MVGNDLDIDVENNAFSLAMLHELTGWVLDEFTPVWFEGKCDTVAGKRRCFLGFETYAPGELWNVDIWFLDPVEIAACERYCDDVQRRAAAEQGARDAILRLKRELLALGLYSFDQYTSMDVYDAVLNRHIRTTDEFVAGYPRRK